MLRGEFHRCDGLIQPNNITTSGASLILQGAFTLLNMVWYMGLVDASPDADLKIEDCVEPTIGVNGYARQALTQDAGNWPGLGTLNGEPYIESAVFTYTATGAGFDKGIRRVMLTTAGLAATTGDVFCLGAPLAIPLSITPATPLAQRQFKYRIYLR